MNLDLLLEPVEAKKPKPCKVAQTISALEDPYKSALEALVAQDYSAGGLSDAELSKRLMQAGLNLGSTVIHYHRRSVCSCARAAA